MILLFQTGGPSQMDLFDPKPELQKRSGQQHSVQFESFQPGSQDNTLLGSPFKFAPRGECGMVMSELFPHLATVADDLTMIRSMRTNEINHGSGELFLHTGHGRLGRPTFGA